ncbi:MAG: ATP-binding protein [Chloroflexaceae bacterium]|nr:ATP-binding protein [Chloroflexaceae bacterium]NJO04275.1 ATP-binding protein [Chloroflexaceae bacterium]
MLYVCERCKDAGYYVLDVPVTHPEFGKLKLCDCRDSEHMRRAAEERRRLSNLGAFADKTFETFDTSIPGVQDAYHEALTYAGHLSGWLVLFGSCGSGKTHLAAAIANRALERNVQVIFAVVPDLLDHLRSTFGPSSDVAYDERFETVREVPLLILDDLGTENTTPWAREKLYQLINHRYNYRLPTIVTLNRKLEAIDERIVSRMSDKSLHNGIATLTAGDYRQREMHLRNGKRKRRTS